jgi:transcriptional regulator with XRE-family HTH domain
MTRRQVPVDDATVESVTEEEWSEPATPLRVLIEQANSNERSAAALSSARADIAARMESLRQLREARALTQATIGELLGMTQSEVSRLERRSDMLLSTLRRFVQAAGGDLALVVRFPSGAPVELHPHVVAEPPEEDLLGSYRFQSLTDVVRSLPNESLVPSDLPEQTRLALEQIALLVLLGLRPEVLKAFEVGLSFAARSLSHSDEPSKA